MSMGETSEEGKWRGSLRRRVQEENRQRESLGGDGFDQHIIRVHW